MKADFFYECHNCKQLIDGHFETNATDPVVMVKDVTDKKGNTFLFECETCNEKTVLSFNG